MSIAAAAAFGCAMSGPASAATNLIANGSFETGTNGLGGWTLSAGFTDKAILYTSGASGEALSAPTAGLSLSPDAPLTHGLYFVTNNTTETISEQVVISTAGTYDFGFDYYVPANGKKNGVDATLSASFGPAGTFTSVLAHSTAAQQWFYVNQSVFADVGTYNFSISFATGSGSGAASDFVVDQAYVVREAPLPLLGASPIAFAVLGAGLYAARRRRTLAA